MLYSEIIAVCSQIHTKHINTVCGQNVELLNVKTGGAHSDHRVPGWLNLHMTDQDESGMPKRTIKPQAIRLPTPNATSVRSELLSPSFLLYDNHSEVNDSCVNGCTDTKRRQHCKMYQHPDHSVKDAWTDKRMLRTSQTSSPPLQNMPTTEGAPSGCQGISNTFVSHFTAPVLSGKRSIAVFKRHICSLSRCCIVRCLVCIVVSYLVCIVVSYLVYCCSCLVCMVVVFSVLLLVILCIVVVVLCVLL